MLSINFTDCQGAVIKTYSVVGMKLGIVDKFMDLREKQKLLQIGTPTDAEQRELWDDMNALAVEIFGRQFTYDELKEGADIQELIRVFEEVGKFIEGSVSKN